MLPLLAALLALGTWLGSIIFQSAVVAPVAFSSLDQDGARRLLRRLFPRFFRLGIACGVVALSGIALAGRAPGSLVFLIVAGMLFANVIALAMVPAINAASDAGAAGKQRFRILHGTSVLLTLGVLAGCIAVVAMLTASLAGGVS